MFMQTLRSIRSTRWLLLAVLMFFMPAGSYGQVVGVSISIAPPALPVYGPFLTSRPQLDPPACLSSQGLSVQEGHRIAPLANSLYHCRNQSRRTTDRFHIHNVSALSDRGSYFHRPGHFLWISA